jgi:ubiquinone/menaquinone biosynthesis C-methylase UbiE
MTRVERMNVLAEAKRILKRNGKAIALEVDNPDNIFVRIFIGLWFFYWLPANFETPTRREMLKYGLDNEFREAGFVNVGKVSKFQRIFQIIDGDKL